MKTCGPALKILKCEAMGVYTLTSSSTGGQRNLANYEPDLMSCLARKQDNGLIRLAYLPEVEKPVAHFLLDGVKWKVNENPSNFTRTL